MIASTVIKYDFHRPSQYLNSNSTWKLVELVGWWALIVKAVEVLTFHVSIVWKENVKIVLHFHVLIYEKS